MNAIFATLAAAAAANERVALGILTRVKGSSPQKSGAKAVFHADGKITGTLGGGCLEAEAQRLALNALKTGKPETFELVLDHDFGWDDGLICGGKVFGVIIPNAQLVGENFWNDLAKRDAIKSWGVKNDFSLARVEGRARSPLLEAGGASVPASWLVSSLAPPNQDGAHGVTRPTTATSINYQPSTINFLYTETLTPPCALWIAGSGHIAQAVAPLALQLDFAVSIFDDRPELANHNIFPREVSLHVGHWDDQLNTRFAAAPTFGLIVTRGHKHDALVLETWIHRPFQFLGMIGSARKARTITEHFIKKKIATGEEVARVACPVGIKIGSESVPEIAVSIMAQYIEKRAGGKAPSTNPAQCGTPENNQARSFKR
jgi:xanthine dehydrogenase accessory factor